MANDPLRGDPRPFGQHQHGVRIDNIRHACPDCQFGHPNPFCVTCLGAGDISEATLARWVARKNASPA